MAEFTVLQRLFRTALSGQLGTNFPLEKLGTLTRELNTNRPSADGYITPRWNTQDIERGYALNLLQRAKQGTFTSDGARRLAKNAPERLLACSMVAPDLKGATRYASGLPVRTLAEAAAAVVGEHEVSAQDRAFAAAVQAAIAVLNLRRVLGVHSAENRPGT